MPDGADRTQLHATCVAIDGAGVLLLGPSGAGKSDLALRLIGDGWALVADDRVDLRRDGARLIAGPPPALAGLLEVRGIGIRRMRHLSETTVRLAVDLVAPADVPRLPEPAQTTYLGVAVPHVRLAAFEASAPAKIRLALSGDGRDMLEAT